MSLEQIGHSEFEALTAKHNEHFKKVFSDYIDITTKLVLWAPDVTKSSEENAADFSRLIVEQDDAEIHFNLHKDEFKHVKRMSIMLHIDYVQIMDEKLKEKFTQQVMADERALQARDLFMSAVFGGNVSVEFVQDSDDAATPPILDEAQKKQNSTEVANPLDSIFGHRH